MPDLLGFDVSNRSHTGLGGAASFDLMDQMVDLSSSDHDGTLHTDDQEDERESENDDGDNEQDQQPEQEPEQEEEEGDAGATEVSEKQPDLANPADEIDPADTEVETDVEEPDVVEGEEQDDKPTAGDEEVPQEQGDSPHGDPEPAPSTPEEEIQEPDAGDGQGARGYGAGADTQKTEQTPADDTQDSSAESAGEAQVEAQAGQDAPAQVVPSQVPEETPSEETGPITQPDFEFGGNFEGGPVDELPGDMVEPNVATSELPEVEDFDGEIDLVADATAEVGNELAADAVESEGQGYQEPEARTKADQDRQTAIDDADTEASAIESPTLPEAPEPIEAATYETPFGQDAADTDTPTVDEPETTEVETTEAEPSLVEAPPQDAIATAVTDTALGPEPSVPPMPENPGSGDPPDPSSLRGPDPDVSGDLSEITSSLAAEVALNDVPTVAADETASVIDPLAGEQSTVFTTESGEPMTSATSSYEQQETAAQDAATSTYDNQVETFTAAADTLIAQVDADRETATAQPVPDVIEQASPEAMSGFTDKIESALEPATVSVEASMVVPDSVVSMEASGPAMAEDAAALEPDLSQASAVDELLEVPENDTTAIDDAAVAVEDSSQTARDVIHESKPPDVAVGGGSADSSGQSGEGVPTRAAAIATIESELVAATQDPGLMDAAWSPLADEGTEAVDVASQSVTGELETVRADGLEQYTTIAETEPPVTGDDATIDAQNEWDTRATEAEALATTYQDDVATAIDDADATYLDESQARDASVAEAKSAMEGTVLEANSTYSADFDAAESEFDGSAQQVLSDLQLANDDAAADMQAATDAEQETAQSTYSQLAATRDADEASALLEANTEIDQGQHRRDQRPSRGRNHFER